jgi:Carboxypeptidase regulatory-like domain
VIEDKIKKYFLGELTETETNSFEEEFAQNSELAEQVQIVESELVDAFVKNQLTQKEIKLFETNYLTTEKRFEKLNFAKLFAEHLTKQTKPRTIIETVNHKSGWYQQLFIRLSFAGLIFTIISSGIVFILFRQVNKNNVVNTEQISQSNVPENKENTNIAIHQESSGNNLVQENSKSEISDNQNNSVEHLKNKGNNKKAAHFQNTEKNKTQKPKVNRPIIPDITRKVSTEKPVTSLVAKAENVETPFVSSIIKSNTSSVSGSVVDSQSEAISGATVTLKSDTKNFSRAQVTNADGLYKFTLIPPGKYKITIEKQGFKKASFGEIQAQVDTSTSINISLEVGNAGTEVVTVTKAQEVPINSTNGSIGNTITTKQIIQLPLESRNTADLLSLQPGATSEGSVAGGRSDQANITLNGADINEEQRGGDFFSVLRITPKELQEFRVTTTSEVNAAENVNNIGLFTILERTLQSKGEQVIEIAIETNKLILWLDLPIDTAKYQTYQAVIKTAEGNIVFADSNLKSPKIILPADKLQNANYVIFLGGVSSKNNNEYIAKYTFRTHTYKH